MNLRTLIKNHFSFTTYSIDATIEPDVLGPRLGRLVNYGRKNRNCVMKTVEINKKPFLCLFAVKDIKQGKEFLYDYGIKDLPFGWYVHSESLNYLLLFQD